MFKAMHYFIELSFHTFYLPFYIILSFIHYVDLSVDHFPVTMGARCVGHGGSNAPPPQILLG